MAPPILVGVDPLRHDPEAPVLAALLARATGAPVVAVAAYPHVISVRIGGEDAGFRGPALARLSGIEPAFYGVPLETVALDGPSAAHVLRDLATDRGAGLLVLGSSHHGAIGRIALGSTADRLLHGAPCPVAVAPTGFAERMRGLDRIGAAFIDSEEGYEALRAAAALASACGAQLHAATAVHHADVRDHAARRLREALAGLTPAPQSHHQVLVNSPVSALEQFSNDVDLLVCGSRGYGTLGSVLLGGVSRRLIHSATCPVIVVPRGRLRALETLAGNVLEVGRA
jgi:nucleotide-binding universal stress UspA family protein